MPPFFAIASYWQTDAFDHFLSTEGVVFGVKSYADSTAVAFPGSETLLDWERDFQFEMIIDPDLDQVEKGFMTGMRAVLVLVLPLLPKDKAVLITGHSLGASRAHILAALLVSLGYNVVVVTFGSPRPGGQKLKEILAPFPVRNYKNNNDPVCGVPFTTPTEPYILPGNQVVINAQPIPCDPWLTMRDHHCQLYCVAIARHLGG
jgi:hypothetical protein